MSEHIFLPIYYDQDPDCQIHLFNKEKGKRQSLKFIFDSGCDIDMIINLEIAEKLGLGIIKVNNLPYVSATLLIHFENLQTEITFERILVMSNVSTTNKFDTLIGQGSLKFLAKNFNAIPGERPSGQIKFIPFFNPTNDSDGLCLITKKGTKLKCIIDTGSYGSNEMFISKKGYELLKKEKQITLLNTKTIIDGPIKRTNQKAITKKISLKYRNIVVNFKNLRTCAELEEKSCLGGYDVALSYNFICLLSDNHSIVPVAQIK